MGGRPGFSLPEIADIAQHSLEIFKDLQKIEKKLQQLEAQQNKLIESLRAQKIKLFELFNKIYIN